MKKYPLFHVGLFEGVGGFGLAAKLNGIETIATCEINEFGNKVTAYHFPEAYRHGDVRTLTKQILNERLIPKYGAGWSDRTILTAGFPCQPFSVAGRRAGADDDRYLWPETLRVIAEVRPAWVIGENVAGILSMVQPVSVVEMASETNAFGEVYDMYTERSEFIAERICQELEGVGYSVIPFVVPACAVGAPHRRDRIWFVAHSDRVGWQRRCSGCNGENEDPSQRTDVFSAFGRHGEEQSSPNSSNTGSEGLQCQGKNRTIESRATADSSSEWRRELRDKGKEERARNSDELSAGEHTIPNWINFPTVSPLCSGDDGLPIELAGISFPTWRRESITAMGNAVVPQIPQLMMSFIKEIEN